MGRGPRLAAALLAALMGLLAVLIFGLPSAAVAMVITGVAGWLLAPVVSRGGTAEFIGWSVVLALLSFFEGVALFVVSVMYRSSRDPLEALGAIALLGVIGAFLMLWLPIVPAAAAWVAACRALRSRQPGVALATAAGGALGAVASTFAVALWTAVLVLLIAFAVRGV